MALTFCTPRTQDTSQAPHSTEIHSGARASHLLRDLQGKRRHGVGRNRVAGGTPRSGTVQVRREAGL